MGSDPDRCLMFRRGAHPTSRGRRQPPSRGAYPRMAPMGAQGTRAIDAARRAGVAFEVHEYAARPARVPRRAAVAATRWRRSEALGLDPARVFKTIVVSVDGRLGLAVVPADTEVDLKAVADALGGRRAVGRRARRGGAGDGLRAGRHQPARHATRRCPRSIDASAGDWPTIHVSAGRRGLELELAAADLVRLTGGTSARRSPAAAEPHRARADPRDAGLAGRASALASCRAWRGASGWRSTWRSRSR